MRTVDCVNVMILTLESFVNATLEANELMKVPHADSPTPPRFAPQGSLHTKKYWRKH